MPEVPGIETSVYQSIWTGEEIDDSVVKINAHIIDEERHITNEEREKWNGEEFKNSLPNYNGIYRGKDITDIYSIDQLAEKVSKGDFSDLYLGDYFTVHINTTLPDETAKTENVSLMIAAFDYYLNNGDTALTNHHIVLIPRGGGFATTAKMNDTDTTEGGYLNSYMHKTVLPCYAASLKTALKNHLLSHRELLTNKVTTTAASAAGAGFVGSASGWEWADVDLCLMTEVEVFGTTVFSSSGYDVGSGCEKLPVFNFINPVQYQRGYFWLRAVTSATAFAACYNSGYPSGSSASSAICVRPLLLFG